MLISTLGVYFTLAQEGTLTEGSDIPTPSLPSIPFDSQPPEMFVPTASPAPTLSFFEAPEYFEGSIRDDMPLNSSAFDSDIGALAGQDLILNGQFVSSGGTLPIPNWYTQGSINLSTSGTGSSQFLKFYRSGGSEALVMQNTGATIPANRRVTSSFMLGNSSSYRRRITVILHDSDFTDQQTCIFWLEPNTIQKLYSITTYTNETWTNASVSFYDPTTSNYQGWIELDSVSMLYSDGSLSSYTTTCYESQSFGLTPTPAPTNVNTEMLQNGNFSQGYAPWVRTDTASQLVGGKLDFYKSGAAHVLYQNTQIDLPQYSALQLVMEVTNTSSVRRRMTIILNDVNWGDFRYCSFWLPANTTTTAPQVFVMSAYTLKSWTDVNVSIYDSLSSGNTPSLRIDNVRLRNGGIPLVNTTCETNPPFCPAGFEGDVRTGCGAQTPTLEDFGIEFVATVGSWTDPEKAEVLTAAILTGQALAQMGAGDGDPVQAFREVMQGMNGSGEAWRRIKVARSSTLNGGCSTIKKGTVALDPDYSAAIDCAFGLNMTQYTAVHELGHVFVGRTTPTGQQSAYRERVRQPNGAGTALFTPSGTFLMGPRTLNIRSGQLSDWQRSDFLLDQGWGSAAQWNRSGVPSSYWDEYPGVAVTPLTPTRYPIQIPRIGPCDPAVPISFPPLIGTPFHYQQNPCTYSDERAPGLDYEIEEAAADMFLNWVYWKISPGVAGFLDNRWRRSTIQSSIDCYPNGCSDNELPGQSRGTWMNTVMVEMFTQFGW